MDYQQFHQQGAGGIEHGAAGEFNYNRPVPIPPRHQQGWHPNAPPAGGAPTTAGHDHVMGGQPQRQMSLMQPMQQQQQQQQQPPSYVSTALGPVSLDPEGPNDAHRYAQNEALYQQMRGSGQMPKPPPPHYYSAGNYGARNVGPGVGVPPVVMLPPYVAHQQGMGQPNTQGAGGQQAPPPPGVAQRFMEQPAQQRHDSPSLSGPALEPPPLPHDYKRQAATGPKGVPVRAPAPYAPSAAPTAHSSKPPRGPLPMKDPGFSRDQKRHPTLGQMAAQVQAQAQASKQQGKDSGGGDDDMEPTQVCSAGSENTGRWTKTEHERFLNALKKYGKEWKKVAAAVRTRTVVQTRTHAQKYFQKLHKQMASGMNLEKALEVTMEDDEESDVESDNDAGGRHRGAAAKKRGGGGVGNVLRALPPPPRRAGGGGGGGGYMTASPPPDRHMSDMEDDDRYSDDDSLNDDQAAHSIHNISHSQDSARPISPSLLNGALKCLSTAGGSGVSGLSISIPKDEPGAGPNGLRLNPPHPSPAACGKRKATELEAAQALAGVGSQDLGEAVDVLKTLRDGGDGSSSSGLNPADVAASVRARVHQQHKMALQTRPRQSLSITHPDDLEVLPAHELVPPTPWDTEVQRLNVFQCGHVADAASSAALEAELVNLIKSGDVVGLKRRLQRAREEQLAQGGKGEVELHHGNDNGQTPLHVAAAIDLVVGERKAVEMCAALLEHATSPLLAAGDKNRCTALHWAARKGNSEVVRMLVQRNAPLNVQNSDGDTPLHWACKASKTAVIQVLIEGLAHTHTRNKANHSVLDVAGEGFESTLGVLRSEEETRARERLRDEVRRTIFELEPRMRTIVAFHNECLEHSPGSLSVLEGPERVEAVMSALTDPSTCPPYQVEVTSAFDRASVEAIVKVHSPEYVQFLDNLSREVVAQGGQPVPFTAYVPKHLTASPQGPSTATLPHATQPAPQDDPNRRPSPTPVSGSGAAAAGEKYFSGGSLQAARRSAGAVIYAVDQVVGGRKRNAFCVVRPPGHQAGTYGMRSLSSGPGLCLLNNVAIGALHALELCDRVAILDLGAHHGVGTEEVIRAYPKSDRLFLFSIHLAPTATAANQTAAGSGADFLHYSPGSGERDHIQQNIYNVPMAPLWASRSGSVESNTPPPPMAAASGYHASSSRKTYRGRQDFRAIVTDRLLPMLRTFNPNLILLSTGFDSLLEDVGNHGPPSTPDAASSPGLDLTLRDVSWVTRKLQEVADMCCNGRIISVLEGGYGKRTADGTLDRSLLGAAARAHVASLINPYRSPGRSDEDDDLEDLVREAALPATHPLTSGNKGADPAAFLGPAGVSLAVTTGENQTHKQ